MGYIAHHTIVVTSWDYSAAFDKDRSMFAETARQKAIEIFGPGLVSNMVDSWINGYKTFFIAPDGSKEGWDESNKGDSLRKEFKKWLESQAYEDGSNHYDWAEIRFGGDEPQYGNVMDYNGKGKE